jgi:hypothetical protein
MQRDRDKQEKAREKQERRAARAAERSEGGEDEQEESAVDEASIIDQLASLQEAYDDGKVELEEFMSRREELQQQLM